MKLAIVHNVRDHKLLPGAYSQTYAHMLEALINHDEWESVQIVAGGLDICDDVDVIVIYDIHSSYHMEPGNLSKHKALKYTYFNDPHQEDTKGIYKDGTPLNKLGRASRIKRARDRGVNFIICPYTDGYYKFLAPELGSDADKMFFWFPTAPKVQDFKVTQLAEREQGVLGNGHLWEGVEGFRPYKFRNWAYRRDNVDYVKHHLSDDRVPCGNSYTEFISKWKGGLALTDWYVVPKYLEIPLAGCLCFAQKHEDYDFMGFKHGVNYIQVDENNFDSQIRDFLDAPEAYQYITDAGRKLIEENFTAKHFAKAVFDHAKENI